MRFCVIDDLDLVEDWVIWIQHGIEDDVWYEFSGNNSLDQIWNIAFGSRMLYKMFYLKEIQ